MSVIVLLSGGLDSATVLGIAAEEKRLAGAVFVDYGQPALSQEWTAACLVASHFRTECARFSCHGQVELGDTMRIGAGASGARVVPGRNALLLSCAVSWAAHVGATEVWYGATAEDAQDYPDCRPAFIRAFSAMSSIYGVTVKAPLVTLWKTNVLRWAIRLRVPVESTWSCYEAKDGKPCGTCNSCKARDLAMAGADRRIAQAREEA